jgi:hypothetical protein
MMDWMLSPPFAPDMAEPIPPMEDGATGMPVMPPLMPAMVYRSLAAAFEN